MRAGVKRLLVLCGCRGLLPKIVVAILVNVLGLRKA